MNNELNITGVKHGLIIGGISAIIAFLMILAGHNMYIEMKDWLTFFISIGMVIYFGRKERIEKYNGYMNYAAMFFYSAITLFIAGMLSQTAHVIVCNVIDPSIKDVIMEKGMIAIEETLRIAGGLVKMSESEIDKALDQGERDLRKSFSPYSILANSWISLIWSIILGAIMALFLKKRKPDFVEE